MRTDALGIFAVLGTVGLSQLVTQARPGSIRTLIDPEIQLVWTTSLFVFGVVGIVAMLLPRSMVIVGLAVEGVARVVLGVEALVYAGALFVALGWRIALLNILTYLGLSALLLVGAVQIIRWLRAQRVAVSQALDEDHDGTL